MRHLRLSTLLGREQASFHDAKINKVQLDYVKREVIFDCLLCTDAEDWLSGRLIFEGLLFFVSESPDETHSYEDALDISSDGSVFEVKADWPKFPSDLPETAFIHYFYVNNWNRCLFIGATEARFEWD